MPKRSSKPSPDPNLSAHSVLKRLTEKVEPPETTKSERQIIAAILGSRGGLKGGKARKEKLTPERRAEIAKAAAEARWSKTRHR